MCLPARVSEQYNHPPNLLPLVRRLTKAVMVRVGPKGRKWTTTSAVVDRQLERHLFPGYQILNRRLGSSFYQIAPHITRLSDVVQLKWFKWFPRRRARSSCRIGSRVCTILSLSIHLLDFQPIRSHSPLHFHISCVPTASILYFDRFDSSICT